MSIESETEYAMCWFDQEQWEELSQVDPEGVDDSYEKWKEGANKAISNFISNGQKVKKISIKTADLVKWCKDKGQAPNSASRSEYVVMLAQLRNDNKKT